MPLFDALSNSSTIKVECKSTADGTGIMEQAHVLSSIETFPRTGSNWNNMDEKQTSPTFHSSVEVIVSPVGMKVTMSSPPSSPGAPLVVTSLVDGYYDDLDDCQQDEKPSLVAVGSASDSEQSFDGYEDAAATAETNVQTVQSNIVDGTQDSSSGHCLSDGFTSFLCPFDQPLEDQHTSSLSRVPSTSQVRKEVADSAHAAAAVSCTELHLQEILMAASTPGAEMLASLQSWLSANPNHSSLLAPKRRTFRNRSCAPKSRDAHVHRLYSRWHFSNAIPMNRTKSHIKRTPSIVSTDSDLCYDSDPGTGSRIRNGVEALPGKKKARHSSLTSFRNSSYKNRRPAAIDTSLPPACIHEVPPTPRNTFNKVHPPTPRNSDSSRTFFGSPKSVTDIDKILPTSEVEQKVLFQEIVNTKINLVWHRCQEFIEKNSRNPSPVAVSAWFELGAHLDHTVVQPKFVWSPTYETNLSKRRVQISGGAPNMLELLSIIRVVAPRQLDRTKYPFARLDRSMCVSTNEDMMFVFEAPSAEERDSLVDAMKMLVARLASIIIVRDEMMLMEFFSPFAGLQSLLDDDAEEVCEEELPARCSVQDTADLDENQTHSNLFFVSTTNDDRARLWGAPR